MGQIEVTWGQIAFPNVFKHKGGMQGRGTYASLGRRTWDESENYKEAVNHELINVWRV